jgi:RNA methyltransferase, TrmH family
MISSAEIKRLAELKDRSGRKEQGLFFIEGKRAVLEAMTGDARILRLIADLGATPGRLSAIYAMAEAKEIEVEEIPVVKFRKLSSTETSQGIIAVARIRELDSDSLLSELRPKRSATVLVLDRVADPGNLGTILRSAAWFGVDGVIIAEGSVDAYNPKVVRSAMAAICQLDVVQDVKLVEEVTKLKALGFAAVASAQDASLSYSDYEYPNRSAIIFGSEAYGIAANLLELCDTRVSIPRLGKMESLNVGVAASIVLSEMARKRSARGRNS